MNPQYVYFLVLVLLWVIIVGPVNLPAQAPVTSTVTGAVVMPDGQPVEDASVYIDFVAPVEVKTDAQGKFRLEGVDRIIRVADFVKGRFQPRSVIVNDGVTDIRITVDNSTGSLVLPSCRPLKSGEQYLNWGNYGIKFIASGRTVYIKRGKADVDYIVHTIKTKTGESILEFWFGGMAISVDPREETLTNSSSFDQRYIAIQTGAIGIDSRGILKNGSHWRQAVAFGEGGAIYRSATAEDAKLFDLIVDSMCFVPYPR